MQFLTPLFLAGLAAIGIPLWFHLIRKEQSTRVPFSSLRYVPPKEMEMVKRQHLRQWPLFLLRLLLVALLTLALARPYWRQFVGGWSSGSLSRVILVDNSFSMRAAGRWSSAQAAALAEVASAPPGSEVTLALVSDRVDVLSEPDEAPASLQAKIRQAEPSYRATRLDQGVQFASDLLKQSRMGTREIVVVSDFQKNGLHLSSWTVPEGAGLRTVDVPKAEGNLFIEDVQIPEASPGGAKGDLTLRIQNAGGEEAADVSVQLKSDDGVLENRASIPAGGATSVAFPLPELKDRALLRMTAKVQASDSLAEDNEFHFVLRKPSQFPVVLSASGAARLYLGEVIRAAGPQWELKIDAALAESLKNARVLVLHDPEAIPEKVASWVKDGGGLLIFSGAQSGERLRSPLLPVAVKGNRILRPEREEALRLGDLERQHPIFQIFAEEQQHYLSTIHFYGYTSAEPTAQGQVLARFNSESPALVEAKHGRGRVLWFASSVSNDWNDFSIRPAFLPFVQQMVSYLAGAAVPPPLHRAGERLDLSARTDGDAIAIDPAGQRVSLPADRPLLDFETPGFYELRYNRLTDYAAVNVPASESNLESEPVKEVQARAGEARAAAAEITAQALEHRQSWWRILLLAMALVLLAEWLVADLYYGGVRSAVVRAPQGPTS